MKLFACTVILIGLTGITIMKCTKTHTKSPHYEILQNGVALDRREVILKGLHLNIILGKGKVLAANLAASYF